jgi:hypothetical protein
MACQGAKTMDLTPRRKDAKIFEIRLTGLKK